MSARVSIPDLRRQLLARGLTRTPTCPDCKRPKSAADLDKATGTCWDCVRRVLALRRIALIDARLATLWQAAREATSAAQAEAIEAEETTLEQERWELLADADPDAFSRASE